MIIRKNLVKYLFFVGLVLFISSFSSVSAQDSSDSAGGTPTPTVVDLECVRAKLLDPDFVCEITTEFAEDRYYIASLDDCRAEGLNCDPERGICIYDAGDETIEESYICNETSVDPTGSQCGGPCPVGERCVITNPIEVLVNGANENWRCLNPNVESLNIFGADVGPIEVFLPRLVRLIFSVLLAIIGLIFTWQLITAIWEYTTTEDASMIEATQKKILNAAMGVFFIAAAIVIVQIIASSFGISGNIFDFSYP